MRRYNLFRSTGGDGLCCAVPECRVVPAFVTATRWRFDGRVEERATDLPGFDGRLAATSVRFNGFYLFEARDRETAAGRPDDGAGAERETG